ncbi:uncharacterized protein EI90DRAFT_3044948 [Cantharellus anzutake]|uniref:uncharacterized protein n=1 Tax=Cantharellus anzutake TaxID=1750568 RepID=UPI0019065097|nr:uncharacterized protein EI90DRAFT_3044948 [Cantharellus anzutake]KAF8337115.1 hypothetical protein EI90DRAFT_3044948 [Cantharellus anzutake]
MHPHTYLLLVFSLAFACSLASFHDSQLIRRGSLVPPHTEAEELQLGDVVLAASVDGNFHAFDRINGRLKWSMQTLPSGPANQSLLYPLVHSEQPSLHDIHDDGFHLHETFVIEPQSGEIFILPPGGLADTPLERLPYTIMQLVDLSPFQFPGDDQRMFLGRKETSMITLDLNSGKVLSVYKDDQCIREEAGGSELGGHDENSLHNFEDGGSEHGRTKSPPPKPIRIGRTDYHVSIRIKGQGIVQRLSFSAYGPNNVDKELQTQWVKTPDDRYVQSLPSGDIISFSLSDAGSLNPGTSGMGSKSGLVAWHGELPKPVVAVFDVLTSPSRDNPFVLIQPQPKLIDIFQDPRHRAQIAELPESTFVGLVGDSLYAMSHLKFPMVVFSDALPYHFDRSSDGSTELVASSRLDHNGHCRNAECYLGTHPSRFAASSRISRLIEGSEQLQQIDASPPNATAPTPANYAPLPIPSTIISILAPFSIIWIGTSVFTLCCIVGYTLLLRKWGIGTNEKVISTDSVAVLDRAPFPGGAHDGTELEGEMDSPPKNPMSPAPPTVVGPSGTGEDAQAESGGNKGEEDVGKEELDGSDTPLRSKEGVPQRQQQQDIENTVDDASIDRNPNLALTVSDNILGYGSHGTVVYQGSFQGRAVAVKRLLQDFVKVASREVALLQESDDHPNVIRYYYQETRDNFDVIQRPVAFGEINATFVPKRTISQITAGLQHLHSLKIVHRDIKPQNILFSQAKNGQHRMLISDFGLCKKLELDETSFVPTRHGHLGAGSIGWRAPEILRGEVNLDVTIVDSLGGPDCDSNTGSMGSVGPSGVPGHGNGARTRLTKSVDLFALGCLFYYTLTNGEHPFGGPFEREANILKDAIDLSWLERFGEEGIEAKDLINKMLDARPRRRPDTAQCLVHPFFWTPGRRLTFLQDASDRFEIMQRDPPELGLQRLEAGAPDVVGNDWSKKFDKAFIENLGKFRKYNGRSILDLLRALRNKKHHYQDLPENLKRHLGSLPDGFLAYFTRRFPALFLHVYYVIADGPWQEESIFRPYFQEP